MTYNDFLKEVCHVVREEHGNDADKMAEAVNAAEIAWRAFNRLRTKYEAMRSSQGLAGAGGARYTPAEVAAAQQFTPTHPVFADRMDMGAIRFPRDPLPIKKDGVERAIERMKKDGE